MKRLKAYLAQHPALVKCSKKKIFFFSPSFSNPGEKKAFLTFRPHKTTKGNNTWILPARSADPLALQASRINPQMGQVPSQRENVLLCGFIIPLIQAGHFWI
ncbi:unnamed protein product [Pipistrellus nathusii]|uniref:Uncharacterized protein n=1 Tax=Pipistrellus nathusii TaxID=59473 RepID=A0ABN9ZC24_PIPNA